MDIIISLVLAFVTLAISQVMRDLREPIPDRLPWARHPTLGVALMIGATWFVRPFSYGYAAYNGHLAKAIAYGSVGVLGPFAIVTVFFWVPIAISTHY